ncbi:FG-GAP repeat protein [Microbulbifer sp. JMSA004]|uniref:FG-GAP repeat protein n=1 Tax=Microbulbifer sp. JMSA004 TaxID=3243370 RepID=UPI00403A7902
MYYVVSKLEPAAMILIRLLLGLVLSVVFILSTVFGGDDQGHAPTIMIEKVASPAVGSAFATHTSKYLAKANGGVDVGVGNKVATDIGGDQKSNEFFSTRIGDFFNRSIALSANGLTLAVAAPDEASAVVGINDDHASSDSAGSGAVYVFSREDGTWHQQAYIKASNSDVFDRFGISVALSADGHTLIIGAYGEASATTGIDRGQVNNDSVGSGAVYMFVRADDSWHQQAYIETNHIETGDSFGGSIALSPDGHTLVFGTPNEDRAAIGIMSDQANDSAEDSGVVYLY